MSENALLLKFADLQVVLDKLITYYTILPCSLATPPFSSSHHRSAKQFRDLLARKHGIDSGLAMIIKQRAKANEIDRMDLVGNVSGCDCILGK